ncbi:nucleoside hydrolase [Pseudomonas sp. P9_31]|uniref:nucleoside hydrolase n=1 Tax=Pseudomonas sp. P9_31 TaxID=3043448 RepID=UPI0039B8BD77
MRVWLFFVMLCLSCGALAESRTNLIIDTDPGADDMIALLVAFASPDKLNLLGVTTVAGNVRIDKTSRNARIAREWASRGDVPIYSGVARPLVRSPVYAESVHGPEGISGVKVFEPKQPLAGDDAVSFIITTLRAAPAHSITLALLGPETNLALALKQAPDVVKGIKEVVVMGGAHFQGGNVTPTAEFNMFADAEAAKYVLDSGVQITYLPIDVTHKLLTSEGRISALDQLGNQAGHHVASILRGYIQSYVERYGLPGGPVHDATVIAYLLNRELFRGREIYLSIDTREGLTYGQTIADWYGTLNKKPDAFWVEDGDADEVFKLITSRISKLN